MRKPDLIDRYILADLVDANGNVHWEDIANVPSAVDLFPLLTEEEKQQNRWYAEGYGDATKEINEKIKALLSAQPEPIRINLNEPIKVKLTDRGKEIYYHQYDRINQITGREICKPEFPKEDENGYTEFQLWRFMELYGEHMGMPQQNVIEPLEMVYER